MEHSLPTQPGSPLGISHGPHWGVPPVEALELAPLDEAPLAPDAPLPLLGSPEAPLLLGSLEPAAPVLSPSARSNSS